MKVVKFFIKVILSVIIFYSANYWFSTSHSKVQHSKSERQQIEDIQLSKEFSSISVPMSAGKRGISINDSHFVDAIENADEWNISAKDRNAIICKNPDKGISDLSRLPEGWYRGVYFVEINYKGNKTSYASTGFLILNGEITFLFYKIEDNSLLRVTYKIDETEIYIASTLCGKSKEEYKEEIYAK